MTIRMLHEDAVSEDMKRGLEVGARTKGSIMERKKEPKPGHVDLLCQAKVFGIFSKSNREPLRVRGWEWCELFHILVHGGEGVSVEKRVPERR